MQNPQPKETPADDSREALIFGICDRLYDHGHCVSNVVLAPAKSDGSPDWDAANPTNLEDLPNDEWPDDPVVEKRAAVLIDQVDGCSEDASFLYIIDGDEPKLLKIAGPDSDYVIADHIVARDIGADPRPRQPSRLVEASEKLIADLAMMPELADLADKFEKKHRLEHPERYGQPPAAANDNHPLARYLAAFRGPKSVLMNDKIYNAEIENITGTITTVDGQVMFATRHFVKPIELPVQPKPIVATSFSLRDPTTLPKRDWLFGGHYIRKYAVASVGPGGGGKTAHSISEALAMVTGRPLLDPDGPLTKPLRVWWINAEDPQDEIDRRFHAAAKHFSITNEQIGGRLSTDSGRDQSFVIAKQEGRDLKVVEPFVADLVAEIQRRQIDVLIVDPFVSTHEAQENDNGAMQRVTAAWVRVADEANCCVELVHHVTKAQGEVTAESARGGGAFKDKVRSMRVFNVMTKEEAEKAGVDNHRSFFRVDFGKVNMVASGSSSWRRFVSVPLGNGKGLTDKGDEVGVVEPWRWPSAEDLGQLRVQKMNSVVADVPSHILAGVKNRMRSGAYKYDAKGRPSAADLMVELGLAHDKKAGQKMVEAWISLGEFEVLNRHCDVARKPRDFVEPVFAPTK
jgi:hypothetical protein